MSSERTLPADEIEAEDLIDKQEVEMFGFPTNE